MLQQRRLVGVEPKVGVALTRVTAKQVGTAYGLEFDAILGPIFGSQRRFRVPSAELVHTAAICQQAEAILSPQGVNYLVEFNAKFMGLKLCLVVNPVGIEFPVRAETALKVANAAGTAVRLVILTKDERNFILPDDGNIKLQSYPP